MILLKSGAVFLADIPRESLNQFAGQRPVVILENIGDHKVRVIPLSSRTTGPHNQISLNLLLKDKVSYVSLMYDNIITLNKSQLKTQIGEVGLDAMEKVRQVVALSSPSGTTEKVIPENDITIFEDKKKDIEHYIINSNNILERMTSTKATVTNIVIAIITGIFASLITNVIWIYVTRKFS